MAPAASPRKRARNPGRGGSSPPPLFPATVAQNIARMREVDSAEVIAAAKLAGVHELILRLPREGSLAGFGDRDQILRVRRQVAASGAAPEESPSRPKLVPAE